MFNTRRSLQINNIKTILSNYQNLRKISKIDISSSTATQPILYSCWTSSCSYRVRIALNLKDIPYKIKAVDLVSPGELHRNELRPVNPMERVPALQIDGYTLSESLAIMNYLDETRPNQPILPQDAYKRFKVREICDIIASGIQPLQNIGVLLHLGKERRIEWAQHWITRGLHAVERLLVESAGKYCVGDEITMADCCLIPQVYCVHCEQQYRVDVNVELYPTILRIDKTLEYHPAFQHAHPLNQPDCPKKSENQKHS